MREIALNLPYFENISNPPGLLFSGNNTSIGYLVSQAAIVGFLIGGFLMLFWFAWGVFNYIFSHGDKNNLAKARQRIIWSIIGFLFMAVSFALSQYVEHLIPQQNVNVKPLTVPKDIR